MGEIPPPTFRKSFDKNIILEGGMGEIPPLLEN